MDEKFLFGVVCGMLGGALLVANSVKARKMITEGQQEVKKKVAELGKSKTKKQD